ncbi:type III-B CRISPR module RAMP protein Cmr6 [Candidatus Leptofilum sp.]|uniref:type III-B CRISPR module RAMP protein Cmr6 n=1 Tax=Candidatus Leptofilum sp. TaxID=3241576 RepID=UPI003B58E973
MLTYKRSAISAIPEALLKKKAAHMGLWFDKYLSKQTASGKPMDSFFQHVDNTCEIGEPETYKPFFERWQAYLHTLGVTPYKATVEGKMIVGLGNAAVIETGAQFHHTYGVPFISGSSLKGMGSAYAQANLAPVWQMGGAAHETAFGTQASAGFVTFFDALPLPGKWNALPDVMTVHHRDYYGGVEGKAPADWDDPTPIPFLSVNGTFLIALYAPDAPPWVEPCYGILRDALMQDGVGAKTSSGYGRLRMNENPIEPPFEFKEGERIRGKIIDVNDEYVELQLTSKFARHLPAKTTNYIWLLQPNVGDRIPRKAIGQYKNAIILEIDDEESGEYYIFCKQV